MAGSSGAGSIAEYVEIDTAHGHLALGVDASKCTPALCIDKLETKA
jgi:hypothetical protein